MRIDRIDAISGGAIGVDPAVREHSRLVDAAQQFEGLMLQEMLKPLRSSENKWDSGDKDADKSMDTLSSYGIEAVATAISKGGGLGIARKVVQQVNHEAALKKGMHEY
jgi:Rod binding domain-containing protein